MKNINYGIDLGTTNSGIAKYENGKITIFKNPVGFKDTMPSVVSFRKGRIQIGEKAREHFAGNIANVFTSFKRKMGSDELYFVQDLDKNVSPIELSAMVLSELTNFVSNEVIKSVVITIPASFDTMQSNATKKAGYKAGFEEVVLLQEPIAACLAYSNTQNIDITKEAKWLVYDFGGGTFDVAVVTINARELKVFDHIGNNYLGGVDLDSLLVEQLICPKIEAASNTVNLWSQLLSKENKIYNKLFFELIYKAEEAKKELSLKNSTTIEIDSEELDLDVEITITRAEFELIIKQKFEDTYQLLEKLVRTNQLDFNDIERIILVGGTTYIPYIREELEKRTNIFVDCSLDPTTAVIVGAAYYAGAKPSEINEKTTPIIENSISPALNVELIYEPHTKDTEELVVAILDKHLEGYYRITRNDGAFDTGLLLASQKISEFVPLLQKTTNTFTIFLYDKQQKQIYQNTSITITNGLYSILGQPLPNDICLELDGQFGKSYMEVIFKKNDILPLKKTVYKTISKNILKNSDDKLIINVLEGNAGSMIGCNLSIGYIEIIGKDFNQDLLKGIDIELNFKVSESRDLSIDVYIGALDLEISEVFNPHERKISVDKLKAEIKYTVDNIQEEMQQEEFSENYEYLAKLKRIEEGLVVLYDEAVAATHDTLTDKKYQLDELKKFLIQDFDDLVRHKHILKELQEYHLSKKTLEQYWANATPKQQEALEKIIKNEKEVLQSNNKYLISKNTQEIDAIIDKIYNNLDESWIAYFYTYQMKDESEFTDTKKFAKLIALGEKVLEKANYLELRAICTQLYHLLKIKPKRTDFNNFDGNLGLK